VTLCQKTKRLTKQKEELEAEPSTMNKISGVGVGVGVENSSCENPNLLEDLNLLGFALM